MRLQLMFIRRNCSLIAVILPLPVRHIIKTDSFNYRRQFLIIFKSRFLDLILDDLRINIMRVLHSHPSIPPRDKMENSKLFYSKSKIVKTYKVLTFPKLWQGAGKEAGINGVEWGQC